MTKRKPDTVEPHQHVSAAPAYSHTMERLSDRYGLALTPEIWDQWHDAIKTGVGAVHVATRENGEIWRVRMGNIAVFVAIRDDVIRTVIPNRGSHLKTMAIIAAEKEVSQTEFDVDQKMLAAQIMFNQAGLHYRAAEAKRQAAEELLRQQTEVQQQAARAKHEWKLARIEASNERTRSQAQLFVEAVKSLVTHEQFVEMWNLARSLFPDHPAWGNAQDHGGDDA